MSKLFEKIRSFCGRHSSAGYILAGFFALSFFSLMQATGTFADPDSFYHAKMALLMSARGTVSGFPWLVYTILPQNFADHHFLYHALLVPLVRFFPPLIGIKVATVFINTAFILLFYGFLRRNKVLRPFFFNFFAYFRRPVYFKA